MVTRRVVTFADICRSTATDVGLAHSASGCLAQPSMSGDIRPPEAVFYSHAGYLAHDPGLDAHVLVVSLHNIRKSQEVDKSTARYSGLQAFHAGS